MALVSSLVVVVLASFATPALAVWGPWQINIPSSGGFVQCGANVPTGAISVFGWSIQGTRHPYQVAGWAGNGTLIAVSFPIHDDNGALLLEYDSRDFQVMRIDNQAAASGNGLYGCQFA